MARVRIQIVRDPRPMLNAATYPMRTGISYYGEQVELCFDEHDRPADLVVCFNDLSAPVRVSAPPNRVVKAHHEIGSSSARHPASPVYRTIFTLGEPLDERYRCEPMLGPYYVDQPLELLIADRPLKRLDDIGWVFSAGAADSTRRRFVDTVGLDRLHVLSGRRDICKYDFCRDFRYMIAAENQIGEHYITEKLSDGIITGCYVFYSGSPRAGDHFDPRCFTHIDVGRPDEARLIIEEAIRKRTYERRQREILAERHRLLTRKNFIRRCLDYIDESPAQRRCAVELPQERS